MPNQRPEGTFPLYNSDKPESTPFPLYKTYLDDLELLRDHRRVQPLFLGMGVHTVMQVFFMLCPPPPISAIPPTPSLPTFLLVHLQPHQLMHGCLGLILGQSLHVHIAPAC